MSSQNSQTQKRATLPKGEQQQVDMEILDLVCDMLQLRGSRLQAVLYFCRNRELIARNKTINWYAIDQNVGMKSYESKAYSYKRFVDSIVPNNLPLYPFDVQDNIEEFILNMVKSQENTIRNMSEAAANSFRKELEEIVKRRFNLNGSDLFSYKKQVDKNRYTINQAMKKVRGETVCSNAASKKKDDSCQDSALFAIYDCPDVSAIQSSCQDNASSDPSEPFSYDLYSCCFDLFE
ncbi:Hypothetical_protein [Hexamita inflata]|uniref:Hypothetical_protein n=1 Tax=Hexamita inflata TaxID=28002 RepID=A0AA86TE92_9EUKA|nr:Hypothetical protein HINF_LOCUS2686 [Hexamita inflata]CAI9915043.1 Hypothetical protein HINF_LOCUS2688 [Hexamita inflata]